jgi:hypothetical protein
VRSSVQRILLCSAIHFVVAMLIAILAFGTDMDQLRSRSPLSRGAAAVHDVLWLPHDSALRAVPNAWLIRNTYVIPLAIVINSLLWGALLCALWRFSRRAVRSMPPSGRV